MFSNRAIWVGEHRPCIFDDQSKVMSSSEFHGSLDIRDGSSIDTKDGDTSLLAWYTKGGVHVTGTNGSVWKNKILEIW